jgi:hypothetical protein
MNKHDRDNLSFIMSLRTPEAWEAWAATLSEDDMLYALELVKTAQAECEVKLMEMDEAEEADEDLDCTQALEIINRVKKGVSK